MGLRYPYRCDCAQAGEANPAQMQQSVIRVASHIFPTLLARVTDRGRDEGLTSPLPPNWTGGFPASSFPVSGVSARLTISTSAVFQTKQPLCRKTSVRPTAHAESCEVALEIQFHAPTVALAQHSSTRLTASRHPLVIRHVLCASTSRPPLAPRALPRLLATTEALTPAGRFFGPLRP